MTALHTHKKSPITIRRMDLTGADQRALARLAAVDSHAALEGAVLGAELDGRLLAAVALESGDVIADPFARTTELRRLLQLRAAQLRERRPKRSWWARRPRLERRQPRVALGGSPPGEIISLMRGR